MEQSDIGDSGEFLMQKGGGKCLRESKPDTENRFKTNRTKDV